MFVSNGKFEIYAPGRREPRTLSKNDTVTIRKLIREEKEEEKQ